jgi:DivIVA domain-containing protein
METPKSSQQSSLDSLRTVEFRQTLRGYHIDDVDEYLERVAVEAEALQEQLRQSNERLRQAAERIAQLEHLLADAREHPASERPASEGGQESVVSDETLQRTLLLAQKFVDQTKADAESQARATLAKAEEQARTLLDEAESKARTVTADSERKLREEVTNLEARRAQLAEDLESIGRHFDTERERLRTSLSEVLTWLDKHLQPSPQSGGRKPETSGGPEQGSTQRASQSPFSNGAPASGNPVGPGRDRDSAGAPSSAIR